jgi:multiple antibiotic resistance protein
MAGAEGDLTRQTAVIAAMLMLMVVTYLLLLIASQIERVLGVTGLNVINRTLGILITALAVQFMFDGITESGLLHSGPAG